MLMGSGSQYVYVLLVFFALAGAYFAAAETAYASMNKIRIRNYADDGMKSAKRAMKIALGFDKTLVTILICTNVVHIGFASLTTMVATSIWGESSLTLVTVFSTLFVFLFVEMLPKSIAQEHSETVALKFSSSMSLVIKLLTPISIFFKAISAAVSKVFGADSAPTITEDELYDIIEAIEEEGVLEPDKSELMQSAMDFADTTVQDVLTPRVDLTAVDVEEEPEEILNIIRGTKFSRLPVYEDSIDNIIGVLQIRQYLKLYLRDGVVDLRAMLSPVHFTHKKTNVHDLLDEMSRMKAHMSVVTDDYGGTLGIVTMEDILEELVGEIWDEDDDVVEEMRMLSPELFEVSGDCLVCDVFDFMDYEDDEPEFEHKTMSAWALEMFDTMPREHDTYNYNDLTVSISEIENNRITKIMVQQNVTPAQQES